MGQDFFDTWDAHEADPSLFSGLLSWGDDSSAALATEARKKFLEALEFYKAGQPYKAVEALKLSVKLNYAPAMINLGLLHASGEWGGVELNRARAGYFFLLASDEGDERGQTFFSKLRRNDQNTAKELHKFRKEHSDL